jgi:transcriptional regulator with XRE-family HTH domain
MAEILTEWAHRRARASLRMARSRWRVAELAASTAAYEALRSSGGMSLQVDTVEDIGRALVKARIARGWTQTQLARRLEMPKQQVQRYEATAYARASLHRLAQIARVLGMTLTGTASAGLAAEGRSEVGRMLAGFGAAEAVQAVERRVRLRRLTPAEARRIYDDLCETYYRLAPLHRTAPAEEQEGIIHRMAVRQAVARLAARRGRLR